MTGREGGGCKGRGRPFMRFLAPGGMFFQPSSLPSLSPSGLQSVIKRENALEIYEKGKGERVKRAENCGPLFSFYVPFWHAGYEEGKGDKERGAIEERRRSIGLLAAMAEGGGGVEHPAAFSLQFLAELACRKAGKRRGNECVSRTHSQTGKGGRGRIPFSTATE